MVFTTVQTQFYAYYSDLTFRLISELWTLRGSCPWCPPNRLSTSRGPWSHLHLPALVCAGRGWRGSSSILSCSSSRWSWSSEHAVSTINIPRSQITEERITHCTKLPKVTKYIHHCHCCLYLNVCLECASLMILWPGPTSVLVIPTGVLTQAMSMILVHRRQWFHRMPKLGKTNRANGTFISVI